MNLSKTPFQDTFEFGGFARLQYGFLGFIAAKSMDFFRFNWDEDQGNCPFWGTHFFGRYMSFRFLIVVVPVETHRHFFWSLILLIQVSGLVFFVPISVDAGELCQQEFALVTIVLWRSILISTISWDGFPAWFFPWFSTLNPRSHSRWEPRCFLGDLHPRQSHLDLRWRS